MRVGFEVATFLGNNGTFYYPKEDLIATAVIIKDTENLPTAEPDERTIIQDLRLNLFQHKHEQGPKGRTLDVVYDLAIPNL
jgi:FtsP/CotA-like multicopper oxidase with cupredoxin domain